MLAESCRGCDVTAYIASQFFHPDFGVPEVACKEPRYWVWLEHIAARVSDSSRPAARSASRAIPTARMDPAGKLPAPASAPSPA